MFISIKKTMYFPLYLNGFSLCSSPFFLLAAFEIIKRSGLSASNGLNAEAAAAAASADDDVACSLFFFIFGGF